MSNGRQRLPFSRRRFLLGAGAIAVAGLGAAGVSLSGSSRARASWVEDLVRRNLPGVRIDADSLASFVQDVLATDLLRSRKRALLASAELAMPSLIGLIPEARRLRDDVERRVLTDFLMGSNFFRVSDATREPVVYFGRAHVCPNPFARL